MEGISAQYAWSELEYAATESNEHWQIREMMGKEISDALNRIETLEQENDRSATTSGFHD